MAAGPLFILAGALLGASGVALGAFGAHALKARVDIAGISAWETAVSYHLTHALVLVALGIWMRFESVSVHSEMRSMLPWEISGWSFLVGVVLFSGSLYALVLGGPRLLGPVTPLGGVALIIGWLALVWAALRSLGTSV